MVSKMNELIRCRDCGKPINKDQQKSFFSLCYECFRRFKSSKLNKAFAMRLIGIISLLFVPLFIFMIGWDFKFFKLTGRIMFIIGCIIALVIPLLLIYFGVQKNRKWKISLGEKPIIEKQELITTTSPSKNSTHIKYCPECGTKIINVNQKFCTNCGIEI